jgi:hypothetical protein
MDGINNTIKCKWTNTKFKIIKVHRDIRVKKMPEQLRRFCFKKTQLCKSRKIFINKKISSKFMINNIIQIYFRPLNIPQQIINTKREI